MLTSISTLRSVEVLPVSGGRRRWPEDLGARILNGLRHQVQERAQARQRIGVPLAVEGTVAEVDVLAEDILPLLRGGPGPAQQDVRSSNRACGGHGDAKAVARYENSSPPLTQRPATISRRERENPFARWVGQYLKRVGHRLSGAVAEMHANQGNSISMQTPLWSLSWVPSVSKRPKNCGARD